MNDTAVAPDLESVNNMDLDLFVATLGSTFEHSPWVARGAWAGRPFASVDDLHAAMMAVVRQAPRETQIAFLRGHPELAGKEAKAGTMTGESVGEQASAGLDALSREEFEELGELNAGYRGRHGFPFIIAVRRHTKAQIFSLLRERSAADTATEVHEALRQIAVITRLRLESKLGS